MTQVMKGIRVLEFAEFVFAPAAASLLSDWGADVIKIERHNRGDSYRQIRWGGVPENAGSPLFEGYNRGKRSIGLDVSHPEGRALLLELAKTSDVFITNHLPSVRRKLGVELEDLRAVNPQIIYARASAYGDKGPERERGGFDGTVFWAYSGVAQSLTPEDYDVPITLQGPLGDAISAMNLAGGISAALFHRAQTGEALDVDVSLLSSACWATSAALNCIAASGAVPRPSIPQPGRVWINPFIGWYTTADRRAVLLHILQPDPHIRSLFEHIGRPSLADDPRFCDAAHLFENADAASDILLETFRTRSLADWKERLKTFDGQWAPVQDLQEIIADQQALANDLLLKVDNADEGMSKQFVRGPVQFAHTSTSTTRAPHAFEHTESVLLELGIDWDRITTLKDAGAIS